MPRNGSGVYTLPSGNPVVTLSTISSTWANTTFSDIATALTGSFAANGVTPLTGPLQLTDGSLPAPGLTFASESTSGLYRIAVRNLGIAINGVKLIDISGATPLSIFPQGASPGLKIQGSGGNVASINLLDGQPAGRSWSIVAGLSNPGEFNFVDNTIGSSRLIIGGAGGLRSVVDSGYNMIFNNFGATGPYIAFQRSSVNNAYIGNSAILFGGSLDNLGIMALSGFGVDILSSGIVALVIDTNGGVRIAQQRGAVYGLNILAGNGTLGLSVANFSLNIGCSIAPNYSELLSSNTLNTYIGTSAAAGTGSLNLCTNSVAFLSTNYQGASTFFNTRVGYTLTVNTNIINQPAMLIRSTATSSVFGLDIIAGSSASDSSLRLFNQNGSTIYWAFQGDGGMVQGGLASLGAGIINAAGLAVNGNRVYAGIPINLQNASYTFTGTDANGSVTHNTATAGHSYTMNSGICPVGSAITIVNYTGSSALTLVQGAGVILVWLPTGTTGNRTLAANGQCVLYQWSTDNWTVTGVGLS